MRFWNLARPTGQGSWGDAVYEHLRQAFAGKLDITTTVTLAANVTTTTFNDARLGPSSVILFMPTTANAAGAMTNLYVSSRGKQTATLTHSNTATTDRVFGVVILG